MPFARVGAQRVPPRREHFVIERVERTRRPVRIVLTCPFQRETCLRFPTWPIREQRLNSVGKRLRTGGRNSGRGRRCPISEIAYRRPDDRHATGRRFEKNNAGSFVPRREHERVSLVVQRNQVRTGEKALKGDAIAETQFPNQIGRRTGQGVLANDVQVHIDLPGSKLSQRTEQGRLILHSIERRDV